MPERVVQRNVLAEIAQPESYKKDHHISGSQAVVGVEVRFQEKPKDITVFSDANWANCTRTRSSFQVVASRMDATC